jgi:hypothetical protein
VNDTVPTPGRHSWADLLRLVGEIRRIAFLPSYVMTCDEQMMRVRDLFHDFDHPEDADRLTACGISPPGLSR